MMPVDVGGAHTLVQKMAALSGGRQAGWLAGCWAGCMSVQAS